MADTVQATGPGAPDEGGTRRDFLYLGTAAVGILGTVAAVWPLVHSMNPSASVLALASIEVDLSAIEVGQSITVSWRGKPVFIRRRTAEEISDAAAVKMSDLPDPQADDERVQKPEWLILVGVCTHLGCIPLGQKQKRNRGAYGGWFCPCHGSHYDTSGRIRKGPAPKNLEVPGYSFVDGGLVRIG